MSCLLLLKKENVLRVTSLPKAFHHRNYCKEMNEQLQPLPASPKAAGRNAAPALRHLTWSMYMKDDCCLPVAIM
jgi:hypothetical protein